MKYEVIGWVTDSTDKYPIHRNITASVDEAIIREIRKFGYCFGGDKHEDNCPVLNDGTYVSYSWRGWGAVMAKAWEVPDENGYAYSLYYMDSLLKPEARKYPPWGVDDNAIVPKERLTETHSMTLDDGPFYAFAHGKKKYEIRLFDDKRKKVDIGDYIEFTRRDHPDERIKRRVVDLHLYESFKELFERTQYFKRDDVRKTLRFSPEELGAAADATAESLVKEMRKYYTKAQEKQYGVMAIELEPLTHDCTTKLRLSVNECDRRLSQLRDEHIEKYGWDSEEAYELLDNFCNDFDMAGEFDDFGDVVTRRGCYFDLGECDDYDVDVNNMIRKTIAALAGKEEEIKYISFRYSALITLEICVRIAEKSDEPKPILSLDDDIVKWLDEMGATVNIDQYLI